MKIYQKLKNSKAFKAGIGYTIGNYFIKGLSFLTLPLFSRLMSVEEFGLYNIYLSYYEILTIIIGLALHSSLKSAQNKYKEKLDQYISCIILLPIIMLAIFLVFGNALINWLGPLLKVSQLILNVLIIHSFASSILILYNAKLSLEYKYKNYLLVAFINSFCDIFLSLILMYTLLSTNKYEARVIGTAVPLILLSIYFIIFFFKKSRPTFNKDYFRFGLKYSLPVIPHGLSQVVLASSDKIMIEQYVGTTESGLYSMGSSVSAVVRVTTSSIDTVYGPWFYGKTNRKEFDQIKKTTNILMIVMSCFVCLLMLFSKEIVYLVGGEKYMESLNAVIPLICSMYFTFLYNFPATVEYYYEKTFIIAISSILAALLNILLNYLFIPKFGYVAAAYTTLVSYFLYFLFHYISAFAISHRNFFNWVTVLLSSAIVVGTDFLAVFLLDQLIYRILTSILLLIICAFVLWLYCKYCDSRKENGGYDQK